MIFEQDWGKILLMPRRPRYCPPGPAYHVLNRAVARLAMFEQPADYDAFERVMLEAHARTPLAILGYAIMSNHWHFVVLPNRDDQITEFFRWLTHTHTMRWHAHHRTVGTGHLYQGRFKSFPIQRDGHLLDVLRYIEANPLRAKMVKRAEDWRFGSLWRRENGAASRLLASWPVDRPANWVRWVNDPPPSDQIKQIRTSIVRGRPFGDERFIARTAVRLSLQYTLRERGRPRLKPQLHDGEDAAKKRAASP